MSLINHIKDIQISNNSIIVTLSDNIVFTIEEHFGKQVCKRLIQKLKELENSSNDNN